MLWLATLGLLLLLLGCPTSTAQGFLVISPGSGLPISSCPLELVYPIKLPNFPYSLTNLTTGGALEVSGLIVNTNSVNESRLVRSVALFDFSWRSVTVAAEIKRLKQFGVVAAILTTSLDVPGKAEWIVTERYLHDPSFGRLVDFPIFQISIKNCGPLVDLIVPSFDGDVFVTLNDNDPENDWGRLSRHPGSVVGQAAVGVFNLAIILFAIYKIIMFAKFDKFLPIKMVHVVLFLEIVGSVYRIVFSFDPSGVRLLFEPFSTLFFMVPAIPVSLSLISSFMIQFYWNKALKNFMSRPIEWLLKYLYVLSAFMILLGVTAAVVYALEIPFTTILLIIIFQIIYGLLFIGLFAYTIYTAYGLFKYLRNNTQLTSTQKRYEDKAVRMSKILIITCAFVVVSIFLTAQGTLLFLTTPLAYFLIMIFQNLISGVVSFLNVYVIQEPVGVFFGKKKSSKDKKVELDVDATLTSSGTPTPIPKSTIGSTIVMSDSSESNVRKKPEFTPGAETMTLDAAEEDESASSKAHFYKAMDSDRDD